MEIRKIKKDEYRKLISLMDEAFKMEGDNHFEHLLPKYYYKDNLDMYHYGIFDNDNLIASIGVYPDSLLSKYGKLSTAFIGGVSTKIEYRNQGLFTKLLNYVIKECQDMKIDLLMLGGNRIRYNHFGFEFAGRSIIYNISKKCKTKLNSNKIVNISLLTNDDVKECLDIYNLNCLKMDRKEDKFLNILKSWNAIPYVCKIDSKIIGYFCLKDNLVYEINYKDGFIDDVLSGILILKDSFNVKEPIFKVNQHTLDICDWYTIETNHMMKILNIENVAKILKAKDNYKDLLKKYNELESIRVFLGDAINSGLTEIEIGLFEQDCG